jgi:hypothetical protein
MNEIKFPILDINFYVRIISEKIPIDYMNKLVISVKIWWILDMWYSRY